MSSVAMNGTKSQPQYRRSPKVETRTTKKLPSLLSFCLHVLGLWYGSTEWSVTETGIGKATGDHGGEDEKGNKEIETLLCVEPTSSVNHDGEKQYLLRGDKEIKLRKFRRNCAAIIWFAIPSLLFLCMVSDLMTYLAYLWGKENDALFLVSYFTYIPQLAIIPLMCVFARVRDVFKSAAKNRPPYVLTREYFMMRCNFAHRSKKDISLFFVLTFWPAVNIAIIIYNYIEFEHQACGSFMIFSKCVAISGLLLYGSFCFVIVKLRQSHAQEFEALAARIAQNGEITTDEAKARIRSAFNAYRGFRNLVGTWSTFSTSVGVLGIFTQLYWNYSVNSHWHDTPEVVSKNAIVTYAVMIWSEKLQFLVLPLAVMLGINADYLWRGFQRVLTERLQDAKDSDRVDRLLQHSRRIDTSFKWIKPTAALTLISFYLGLQLNNQNLNYWVGPTCNLTTLANLE